MLYGKATLTTHSNGVSAESLEARESRIVGEKEREPGNSEEG